MKTGDLAPDFTLRDHAGHDFTLSDALTQGPVVLFFYPAAHSRGCTKESCHFRDLAGEFAALGAQRVGISMDDEDRQASFAAANDLDYPLLVDVNGTVAALYGVKRGVDLLRVKRTTFVIGSDRRLEDVIASEFSMDVHADRALRALASRPGDPT
jgi:peroxiredoxin Q/BCP